MSATRPRTFRRAPTRSCTRLRCRARTSNCATADDLGVPVLHRAVALAAIADTRRTIAVAGSHGKTTCASMLALVLRAAGWEPSFVIGGEVNEVGTNAAFGEGEWFVVEADESDGTFLQLGPDAALVTNIEPDHLDFYGGFDALVGAFERFVDGVAGPVVLCADDPVAARLAAARPTMKTYGVAPDAHYRIVDEVTAAASTCRFTLEVDGGDAARARGADGREGDAERGRRVAAIALELGVDLDAVARALAGFGGVARRFQFRGVRRRRHVHRRLRAPPERGRGRDRDRTGRRVAPRASRCSSRTGTRVPRRSGPTSPTRSSKRTRSCSLTSIPRARRRFPA